MKMIRWQGFLAFIGIVGAITLVCYLSNPRVMG